jgi:NAD(P)H-dependent flavin oxidoreductase YrpB (nitropropane dioxygenase family)
MRTRITELLGIEHPIIPAPMGPDMTAPELVAAVSNAGAGGTHRIFEQSAAE